MGQPLVLVDGRDPAVTVLTLNRPEKRNALNIALLEELIAAVEAASTDAQRRVLILRGAGLVFCAGLDLEEARIAERAEQSAQILAKALATVYQSPLVTIAAVHGAAMAGGAGLMATCDLVLAADDLRIGYPEVHRGLVAGLIMMFLLRQINERQVRELLLLGETIDARRALAIGLVNRLAPSVRLLDEALALAKLAIHGAPGAIARTKRLIDEMRDRPITDDLERALRHHMAARHSPEAIEGIAAFFEKRPPSWAFPAAKGGTSVKQK